MCLQTRILEEFRSLYPRNTLRETSLQTGIQLTRVFRIYNGAPMKLAEYERFHELVYGRSASPGLEGSFKRATESIVRLFPPKELDKITTLLERQLQWYQLIHSAASYQSDSAIIA